MPVSNLVSDARLEREARRVLDREICQCAHGASDHESGRRSPCFIAECICRKFRPVRFAVRVVPAPT